MLLDQRSHLCITLSTNARPALTGAAIRYISCRLRSTQHSEAHEHSKGLRLPCKQTHRTHATTSRAIGNDRDAEQDSTEQFKALCNHLKLLSYQELQHLSDNADSAEFQVAFSASFLFWLSAQEKKAVGAEKQELANLAAQLVYIKEQADFEASRRMLPPLASSLAYSNYSSWQADHQGQQLPDVVPGVTIADLYKAAEREEAKLKQWQTPQHSTSSIDTFAQTSGYQQAAAEAMARVKARLMGYVDDDTYQPGYQSSSKEAGQLRKLQQEAATESDAVDEGRRHRSSSNGPGLSPAAEQILQELLLGCCCREERATVLPEAFTPPGLEVNTQDGAIRILTTPKRLLQVIESRQQQQRHQLSQGIRVGQMETLYQEEQLPSGELVQQVLSELAEDVSEYDVHVYRRIAQHGRL